MTLLYEYESLNDVLLSEGAICSVAEVQGMFCGQIAGGREQDMEDWITQAREFCDLAHFDSTPLQQDVFEFLVTTSQERVSSDDYRFVPLLPNDACPLVDRVDELGAWCRGFLHGFGASGVTKDTQLSAEVAEVLRDMAQISQASKTMDEASQDSEDDERDWFELVEYMRAGVFVIYTEMNAVSASTSPSANTSSSSANTFH